MNGGGLSNSVRFFNTTAIAHTPSHPVAKVVPCTRHQLAVLMRMTRDPT
jgi:hypothetical protein